MSATQRWKAMIEREHAQSDRMRGETPPPEDHWRAHAQHFRADPRRVDDPLVNRLLLELGRHQTLIDVGAGGGRLALPLALRCRRVTAVEPSASMVAVLRQQAAGHSIHNVSVVEAAWEDAQVDAADVVLCCHVLYTVQEIEPFVRKLETHARDRVLTVLFKAPPQSQLYSLWQQVHGEDRLPLPSLPEYQEVLSELRIDAKVEILPPQPPWGFDTYEEALEQLSRRLYLAPGSQKRGVLEDILPGLLEHRNGAFTLRGADSLEPGLVWWRPKAAQA